MLKHKKYDSDFYAWSLHQSECLRKKEFLNLDIDNLIEEIESLGRSNKLALKSHLIILLLHLLKLKYQPEFSSNSWRNSISNARREIELLLQDSPSLKNVLKDEFKNCFERACKDAAYETQKNINEFPKECPWTIEEVLGK